MKRILKILGFLALLFGLYLMSVILYGTFTDYQPEKVLSLQLAGSTSISDDYNSFEVIIWNIGFAGLGAESDFFYDGGEDVHQVAEVVQKNLNGITDFIVLNNEVDLILLQEVDSSSSRSYDINEYELIAKLLPDFQSSFAANYKVDFVPLPITNPLGKINSGLASFSRLHVKGADRYRYESQFEWPKSVFFLDRCFLAQRIQLKDYKELIAINTHNSAYDESGKLKEAELKTILNFAQHEYEKGNYVLIGGDWNQCPPGYQPIKPDAHYSEHLFTDSDIPQGWQWVADISVPTNRKLETSYTDSSYTSVIDHYLLSPNLRANEVKVIDLDFQFSDHQPVYLNFSLRE